MNTKRQKYARSEESIERTHASGPLGEATSLSRDFLKEWQELLKSSPRTAKDQIVGISHKNEVEMSEGQEFSLSSTKEETVEISEGHRKYVAREVDNTYIETKKREEQLNRKQVEEIQSEIKKLIAASQEMENAFKNVAGDVSVSKLPEKVGKYHVGFFEWVLTTIKQARSRIENGSAWLAAFSAKKQQKSYWGGTVKKGGFNNVHLSSERSSVNQTG